MLDKFNQTNQGLINDPESPEEKEKQLIALLEARETEIVNLKQKLVNSNQYVNDFAYAAAHALKSPVANLNLITILLERTSDIEELKNYLETIKLSVKRLDQTIQGLVNGFKANRYDNQQVSKIDFQKVVNELKLECFNSHALFKSALKVNFTECKEIQYNKNDLLEILNVLINNAIKFRSHERKLKIEIITTKRGDYVLLELRDNGIGIDLEKYRKDLFQPFRRCVDNSESAGMGLFLAKVILEKNQGKIQLESKLNQGTVVKCYLKEIVKNQ